MNSDEDMIFLNIPNEDVEQHVTKKDILRFFKNLKTMPVIDKELVYKQILDDTLDLPYFHFEEYFLEFCNYRDNQNKELVIIRDIGSDNYYYIQDEKVFKCSIDKAKKLFYCPIAHKKEQTFEDIHDEFINKLFDYEAIFLLKHSKYLCSLDDFIEDNIYMFNEALKEKELKNKTKIKPQ